MLIGKSCLRSLFHALLAVVLVFAFSALPSCGQMQDLTQTQQFGHLALLPPMGWASWNHFFCDYDEKTIRAQADALVSSGMRDAGYKYVVIQECIARERDPEGNLIIDKVRFPSGMGSLTDYIHKLGLKAGIYTDIGKHTCYPNPQYQGSYGHEEQDAHSFAQWGIDFVEMDYCNREEAHTGRYVYEKMAAAIKSTGRPMVFYLCCWGNEQPWEWAQGDAQMWRTDFDISLEKNHVEWWRLVGNFESNTAHSVFSAPESWNDADMLEIGNPGLTDVEARAQFSMWAMSPSPLLAGADLTNMSVASRDIYTNREVIAIDQDSLGAGAELVSRETPGVEVWQRPLGSRSGGEIAVMLLNASARPARMEVTLQQLELQPGAAARDVWAHQMLPMGSSISQTVGPHSAMLIRMKGSRSWKRAIAFEAETPDNIRRGNAHLLVCGECSKGYAIELGGNSEKGAVTFDHIHADKAGTYQMGVLYVRNGLEDKLLSVSVNGAEPQQLRAIMRSWNEIYFPIPLRTGDNQISISHAGKLGFDLDKIELSQSEADSDPKIHNAVPRPRGSRKRPND